MHASDKRPGIAVVSFPWEARASYLFLSDLLRILKPLCETVVVINGNTDRIGNTDGNVVLEDIGVGMHYVREQKSPLLASLSWIAKCLYAQIAIAARIVKHRGTVSVAFFYIIYPFYLIPLIAAKCAGIRTVEIVTRSEPSTPLMKALSLQNSLVYRLIDGISPESNRLIALLGLERYAGKILPEGSRFVDLTRFKPEIRYAERKKVVGFIGRMHEQKGVLNFLSAIPLIARRHPDIAFLIGGAGDLLPQVQEEGRRLASEFGIAVDVPGWIGDDLPSYLNGMALMVLPTYSDALPTIVLEAMACGTPVVATPVGAIPDVVIDRETGFILRENTPECLAETILGIMESGAAAPVSERAVNHIRQHFTFEKSVARFSGILDRMEAA